MKESRVWQTSGWMFLLLVCLFVCCSSPRFLLLCYFPTPNPGCCLRKKKVSRDKARGAHFLKDAIRRLLVSLFSNTSFL
jgi:hypothetical protein